MMPPRSLAFALDHTLCLTVLLLITASTPALLVQGHPPSKWVNHGGGILNHRSAKGQITADNVKELTLAWRFPTGFDVSATPAISDGAIYFPGWNGMLYSLNENTGAVRWIANLTHFMGADVQAPALSRTTPVVASGGLLLVGIYGPAVVLALDRRDGTLVWRSQRLDHTLHAVITMSGTAYKGHYYVGVSSVEEGFEECCSFQGSFQKLSLKDGQVVWKTSMVPPNSGYYGVAVWGSSPSIDVKRRLVFIATGNNYKVPQSVEDCELNRKISNRSKTEPDQCLDRSDHQDSMLALNIDDGSIVWSANFQEYDVWTIPCQLGSRSPNCPAILGPDYDFGEAPMLLHLDQSHATASGSEKCLVVAGQKSGVVWALDCDTGSTVWSTAAGPGAALGGAIWGSSFDGENVYTNIANFGRSNFTLAPSQRVTRGGGWVAMNAHTGHVIWSTAQPNEAYAFGPVSSAKGVVFGTSFSSPGYVYALDARNGSILWSAAAGASIYGGVSIGHSCIYVGDGYSNGFAKYLPNQPKGTSVSAFCL